MVWLCFAGAFATRLQDSLQHWRHLFRHFEDNNLRNIAWVVIDDAEVVTMLAGSGKSDGNSRQDAQMMSQLFGGLKSINGFVRDLKHGWR